MAPRVKQIALWVGASVALAVVALVVIGVLTSSKSGTKRDAGRVAGGAFTLAPGITATDVWCQWVGPGRPQWNGLSLQSEPHVEVHLTVVNTTGRAKRVKAMPQYWIGTTSHGDAWNQEQYETVPATGRYQWNLNAGKPSGVKVGARIAACSPAV
jgi:hypothetical protein